MVTMDKALSQIQIVKNQGESVQVNESRPRKSSVLASKAMMFSEGCRSITLSYILLWCLMLALKRQKLISKSGSHSVW